MSTEKIQNKNRNACIFCLRTPMSNPGISLHSFPKNIKYRTLWLKACGFQEEDIKPSRKLCSLHFKHHCFKSGLLRKCLIPGSIPTKFSSRTKQFFESGLLYKTLITRSITREVQIDGKVAPTSSTQVSNIEILNTEETSTKGILDTTKNKQRKCYVGVIKSSDISTLRKAKHNFDKATFQIAEYRKKINFLNQTVMKLGKRLTLITNLNDSL